MNPAQQQEITTIGRRFAEDFRQTVGPINGSQWLIVDPLSAYLDALGYPNAVSQLPATLQHPQVLVLEFPDGERLIPAGADLKPLASEFENWMWL